VSTPIVRIHVEQNICSSITITCPARSAPATAGHAPTTQNLSATASPGRRGNRGRSVVENRALRSDAKARASRRSTDVLHGSQSLASPPFQRVTSRPAYGLRQSGSGCPMCCAHGTLSGRSLAPMTRTTWSRSRTRLLRSGWPPARGRNDPGRQEGGSGADRARRGHHGLVRTQRRGRRLLRGAAAVDMVFIDGRVKK
jgi:hypothetical protein